LTALYVLGVTATAVAIAFARGAPAKPQPGAAVSGQIGGTAFAPGACVAMAPTSSDRHETVFLDAGHGGPDPGASGTTAGGAGVDESELTLPVVLDAAASLRADGYRVVVSRTVDTSVARLGPSDLTASGSLSLTGEHDDIAARVTCANLSGAAALVSVHFNAFSDATARGLLTTFDDSRSFAAANQHLAQLLDADVLGAFQTAGWQVPDRGVLPDTSVGAPALSEEAHAYGHLLLLGPAAQGWLDNPTTMPGALVEPLFLTDPTEATVAASSAGQGAIAAGIVTAVEAFTQPVAGPTTTSA
jgi:N-acetylmuramoyl-L-alanine amidase